MLVKVETGNRRLEQSGSLILPFDERSFSIHIDDVELEITFRGDADAPEVDEPDVDGKKFSVTLINWNNPLGTTWAVPDLLSADGRSVTIALHVTGSGASQEVARNVAFAVYSSPQNG